MIQHSRAVAFPEYSTLAQVFESFELSSPSAEPLVKEYKGLQIQMGGHITGKNFRCFRAVPRASILEYMSASMLQIQYDSIYFEIVEREDHTALIVAKYNQIIGGRWLALIPGSEIPRKEKA